jgi:hypothetical protein
MNDRDDKSSGMEIRMTDALDKINPTDPLILAYPTSPKINPTDPLILAYPLFICSRLKKRRKPRVKLVTLKLC